MLEEKGKRVDFSSDYQWPFIEYTLNQYRNKKALQGKEGISILDAGCGNGRYTDALLKKGYRKVLAMDLIDEHVFRKSGIDCTYVQGSHTDIPAKDNCFDIIICMGSLFYLKNPEKGLKEFYRVLKPGGMLLVSVATKYSLFTFDRCLRRLGGGKSASHIEFYHYKHSIFSYIKMFRHQNFKVVWIDGFSHITHFDLLLTKLCSLLKHMTKADIAYQKKVVVSNSKFLGFIRSIFGYLAVAVCEKGTCF